MLPKYLTPSFSLVLLAFAAPGISARTDGPAADRAAAPIWNARNVEHLYNRAGFGARQGEIEEGVRIGQRALVERLVRQRDEEEPFFLEPIDLPNPREMRELSQEEQQKTRREYREKERRQLLEYAGWWFERMQSSADPLHEKMVLFWHGFFTTSAEEVKRSYEVLRQNQFLRDHALGGYADLLTGIAKDPAMLVYLDNQVNRKGKPNENFARELMELFSLGVGHYTEQDVKEAARALTGRGTNRDGAYVFNKKQHDDGEKSVLGVTGKLDGDALIAILLKQEACATWVSKRLITWFEGVEPAPERLQSYAAFLREKEYALEPFLERLFLDPAFYRPQVQGARVQGPIEFMVGISHRLGIHAPPAILATGASLLGQRVFAPPSVKGWDEGEAWITTASLMQRGNLAGLLLGVVKVDDVLSQADLDMAVPATEVDEGPMRGAGGSMDEPMTRGGAAKSGERAAKADESTKKSDERAAKAHESTEKAGKSIAKSDERGAKSGENGAKSGEDGAKKAEVPAKPEAKGTGKGGFAYQALRKVESSGWTPTINFSARLVRAGAHTDAEIIDRMLDALLAIDPPADTKKKLCEFLATERAVLEVRDGRLFEAGSAAERLLRRLAHLILSLPEAQLS